VNPGACGMHGFHKKRTLIKFEVKNGKLDQMQVIELGDRSSSRGV